MGELVKGIGVALSGGGHRASLFGLGVLLYLGDAHKLPELTSFASVSGGSLTNGYVAQTLDLTTVVDGGAFERAVKPFARQLAQHRRKGSFPDPANVHQEPAELIVVNSSASLRWVPFRGARVPGVGELLSLLKVKDVLYDQTTATRRRMLYDRARQADQGGTGVRIGLVNIPRSAFDLAKQFAPFGGKAGERAVAVLAAPGDSEARWAGRRDSERDLC